MYHLKSTLYWTALHLYEPIGNLNLFFFFLAIIRNINFWKWIVFCFFIKKIYENFLNVAFILTKCQFINCLCVQVIKQRMSVVNFVVISNKSFYNKNLEFLKIQIWKIMSKVSTLLILVNSSLRPIKLEKLRWAYKK